MIVGGLTPEGQVLPMSSAVLENLASEWAATVRNVEAFGGTELLAKARSLFVLSWFDYDVMVDACLAGFQAVEATFRQVAFPDASERLPFKRLVDRAEQDDLLSADKADVVRAGVELRNRLSHPGGTTRFCLEWPVRCCKSRTSWCATSAPPEACSSQPDVLLPTRVALVAG
jgi:hypothetical protein